MSTERWVVPHEVDGRTRYETCRTAKEAWLLYEQMLDDGIDVQTPECR